MNIETTAQIYYYRQTLLNQNKSFRSSDQRLLFAVAKLLLVVFPIVAFFSFCLNYTSGSLSNSIYELENTHRDLMKTQIGLFDKRIQLYSSEQVQQRAAETLSLYLPDKEQIHYL